MRNKQSFETYFYKNIHAEGCGCSEKIIENFEIERTFREGAHTRETRTVSPLAWLRGLFSRRRTG